MNALLQEKPAAHQDSRQKILDTAETLFARDGFTATSLRAITAEASVNLASVNYYFRSKDQLIVEVLSRAIRPLNEKRLHFLEEAAEQAKSKPASLSVILAAMMRPFLDFAFDPKRKQIVRLFERALSEAENFIHEIVEKECTPIDERLVKFLKKVLPHSPEKEIYWRIHFIIGSVIHTVFHHQDLLIISKGACKWEFDSVLKRLIDHASAGLEALEKQYKKS